MNNDQTPAADRGSEYNDLLGPTVPAEVLCRIQAYGDSRADRNGRSQDRLAELIRSLRQWGARLQPPKSSPAVAVGSWTCSKCQTDRLKALCPLGHSAATDGRCPCVGVALGA